MPKKVAVVLVNYKHYAKRFLSACRDSLRSQTYPSEYFKVYIIDNASTPESVAYLKEQYPEAQVITRPDGNYSAANNLGFQQAIKDGCEYLVTVNMDTETEADWLSELVKALDKNPLAGIAQSKVLLYPRTEAEKMHPKINSLGNLMHFLGFGFTDGYNEPDKELSGYPEIKGYASGCSFIIRKEVFEHVGGYIEEFYMYHDDLEISLKVKLAGYKIILAPRSVIYHKYEFSRSSAMVYYMERNRYLTIMIFYPLPLLLLLALPILFMEIGMLLYSFFKGWFGIEMRIYSYFFRFNNHRKALAQRAKIKKISVREFSEVAGNFCSRIEFQEINNPILQYVINPLMAFYWRLIKRTI